MVWKQIGDGYKRQWCQYRHGDCPHDDIVINCKEFRIGGCYSCKYKYGKNGKLSEKKIDEWHKRGCEIWCPSSLWCSKRKRLSRKRKKRLKKKGIL